MHPSVKSSLNKLLSASRTASPKTSNPRTRTPTPNSSLATTSQNLTSQNITTHEAPLHSRSVSSALFRARRNSQLPPKPYYARGFNHSTRAPSLPHSSELAEVFRTHGTRRPYTIQRCSLVSRDPSTSFFRHSCVSKQDLALVLDLARLSTTLTPSSDALSYLVTRPPRSCPTAASSCVSNQGFALDLARLSTKRRTTVSVTLSPTQPRIGEGLGLRNTAIYTARAKQERPCERWLADHTSSSPCHHLTPSLRSFLGPRSPQHCHLHRQSAQGRPSCERWLEQTTHVVAFPPPHSLPPSLPPLPSFLGPDQPLRRGERTEGRFEWKRTLTLLHSAKHIAFTCANRYKRCARWTSVQSALVSVSRKGEDATVRREWEGDGDAKGRDEMQRE